MKLIFFFLFLSTVYGDTVGVIGSGYVGLVMSAIFSKWGHEVICVDIDPKRIELLKNKRLPLYEPGLADLIFEGNVHFSLNMTDLNRAETVFICVGTPVSEKGDCDLANLIDSFKKLCDLDQGPSLVCIKSTIPPGTIQYLESIATKDFFIVHNPEFMREGSAFHDIFEKNPIVIGSRSMNAIERVESFYSPLIEQNRNIRLIKANPETSELLKYGWNGFSALRITYMNELSRLSNRYQADINTLIQGISWSEKLLPTEEIVPGWGFGGSCLPKDTLGLARLLDLEGLHGSIAHQTVASNKQHMDYTMKKILHAIGDIPQRIALLGVSFKTNTSDIRNAFSIPLTTFLVKKGHKVNVYDPYATVEFNKIVGEIETFTSPYEAMQGCNCLIVMNDGAEIQKLDLQKIRASLQGSLIIDLKNVFSPKHAQEMGFYVINSGRL